MPVIVHGAAIKVPFSRSQWRRMCAASRRVSLSPRRLRVYFLRNLSLNLAACQRSRVRKLMFFASSSWLFEEEKKQPKLPENCVRKQTTTKKKENREMKCADRLRDKQFATSNNNQAKPRMTSRLAVAQQLAD
jgi:hypothetical protein